jgi:hypothetical protein
MNLTKANPNGIIVWVSRSQGQWTNVPMSLSIKYVEICTLRHSELPSRLSTPLNWWLLTHLKTAARDNQGGYLSQRLLHIMVSGSLRHMSFPLRIILLVEHNADNHRTVPSNTNLHCLDVVTVIAQLWATMFTLAPDVSQVYVAMYRIAEILAGDEQEYPRNDLYFGVLILRQTLLLTPID